MSVAKLSSASLVLVALTGIAGNGSTAVPPKRIGPTGRHDDVEGV